MLDIKYLKQKMCLRCSCGHCTSMPKEEECLCCTEVARVQDVMDEDPACQCITLHPGFQPACLNIYVLRIAYLQYRQYYGHMDGETHE